MSDNNEAKRAHALPRAYRTDQFSALLWLIVGVVVILQSRELDYMAEYGPGPGFLPFWLGVGFIILGLALFAKATFLRNKDETIEIPTRHATYQLLLVIATILGLAILAETIGFIICIGLMFFFILAFVERQGWKFSLIMGFSSALVFWIIFELGLDQRLPPGLLELLRR